ncbi:Aldehyde dehydrogenase [Ceratobasidium theobromae]|uniref:Aldehyde dehydrogenase n=1 Tax=Ceratobasidium theobromae TaxID=1582974 RepID=A0A5N5QP57_9AGAM|nr:Aldehyde dehydrogenase [Ceratobasidium theobromae]
MGKFYDSIPESFVPWINEQHIFWVATAPLAADGHVNVSPKGMTGTFKLLGPNACFYQDLSGSGVETISHLRENGRITVMFTAFKGSPRIVRLWGTGIVHELGTSRYNELIPPSERLPGSRAAIEVKIHKVGSSCGYSVPFYEWVGERTLLVDVMAPREKQDAEACPAALKSDIDPTAYLMPSPFNPLPASSVPEKSMRKYWAVKNVRSVDGIPGLHLGRVFAGLPMTRDAVKDNTWFHEPMGPVGRKSQVEAIEPQQRWGPIVGAFVLGIVVARISGISVEVSSKGSSKGWCDGCHRHLDQRYLGILGTHHTFGEWEWNENVGHGKHGHFPVSGRFRIKLYKLGQVALPLIIYHSIAMPSVFEYDFTPEGHNIKTKFSTGLYINGKFVDGNSGKTIDVVNPTTGKVITAVSEGNDKDVDAAVKAAQNAYDTVWGLNVSGVQRGKILIKLAELIERDIDEIAAVEALDNGKAFTIAKGFDASEAAACFRYYGGWADKVHGKVAEIDESRLAYTRHEPIGVVGQIIPWNFPLLMFAWKLAPALATGNTIVIKPSEFTPLSALRIAALFEEAGLPAGVVNVVTGYGPTVGAAISSHMHIEKVAFTGSTVVGRTIMKAAAASNLKNVTLELGGKSPNIIFDDADLEAAVRWAAFGIFFNHGQTCCAGSRVYVQAGVYDKFVPMFTEHIKKLKVGNPFKSETFQGPQVSQIQFDRIMGYIETGKSQGATCALGGKRHGNEGFFIEPTVFTDVKHDMKIAQEEIFGPVVAVVKFTDEADIVRQANDSVYGLAAAVFSRDISRALSVAHKLHAGTVWVNCYNKLNNQMPFGGFKQSGIGRELGEYALSNYTNVKALHVNLTESPP